MSQRELDKAIAEMRKEQVDDKVVRDVAKRVFSRVFDSAFIPDPERIRGCADFQALIPSYLGKNLTPARALLFEDHTRHCVACRHALQEARAGDRQVQTTATPSPKRIPIMVWALAACLLLGIAIGVTGALNGLLPGQHAIRATVMSVEGNLYRVSDFGTSLVEAGALITNAEELRTAKGSRAILRLVSGGEVEMAERSDVSVSRGWRGTEISLERGHIIVDALNPGQKPVYVSSESVFIPVRDAVLSVNRGAKGARIAVAKGSAQVEQGPKTFDLSAGQQIATDYRLTSVPISVEFAWSKNADQYLALLNELSTLQKQFQSIPSPGLRYSSNLIKYVPENTIIYAAVPNLGGTLAEAKRMFDQRLAESDVLREWWQQKSAGGADFDRVLTQITSFSQYLGDEIVFSVPLLGPHQYGDPLFLAEVRKPGLEDFLKENAKESGGQLSVSVSNGLLIASPDAQEVAQVKRGSSEFTRTPFYNRIEASYQSGAGYLLAIDMEQIVSKSVSNPEKEIPPGFNNTQYLLLERRGLDGGTETRASLSFSGVRQGIASWLGTPGAMGSLDFVSPDASFAASFAMKSPRAIMQELISFVSQADAQFSGELSQFQSQAGVNLVDDLAAPLGSDVTFAVEGAVLPLPAWKIAIEVYDPGRLQQTLSTLVERFNQQSSAEQGKLQLASEQINSRTFYSLRMSKVPSLAAYYTFTNGYLLMGSSEANLVQAIQNRQSGHTLVNSSKFRDQLPQDSYANFSGILYSDLNGALAPLASQLKASATLSSAQQQSLSALLSSTTPGLICVYGEPDRIVAATRSSFLGFNLGTLAGIEQGKALLPLISSSAMAAGKLELSKRPARSRE
ncbi:MAG: FecR domain-containing protein [Bryobacteraceae bacterium]